MGTNEIKNKCVLVIDSELPIGLIANTAAILGITLGTKVGSMVGEDIIDASNQTHLGITGVPIPILKAGSEKIKDIVSEINNNKSEDFIMVDFSNIAQTCNDYDDYIKRVNNATADKFKYLGIGIFGKDKKVNKLTGSLPLLR